MIRFKTNVSEVLDRYEKDYLRATGKELPVNLHRLDHIERQLGTSPVLTPVDVDQFVRRFKSAASRNRYRALLHAVVQWGIDFGYIEDADLSQFRAFKKERETKGRTRRMSVDEETRLRDVMGRDLSDLFTAAIDTGLRRGALRRLQVRDVGEEILNVPAEIQKHGESQRIPLTRRMVEIVGRRVLAADGDDTNLFHVANFRHAWDSARSRAGVTGLHWHDLRGEFASRLSEKGVGVETVSRLLGHQSLSMTQRYLRPRVVQFEDAIRKLGV